MLTLRTADERGQETSRGVFTDVFAYRDGRWQAVNAQENGGTEAEVTAIEM
ncbi:MAG TPA: hypothetical protein VN345_14505 [Blastocatellia bacterium]|jgi:hypothetical protein|nr:hypothetical protein [Blastocatellia bacterium]